MTSTFDVDVFTQRLRARRARRILRWFPARRAAVAIVLDEHARVLLMRRAEREGDRWSSHVSLPGGMRHEDDASLAATAERETLEEVGLDLASAERLGSIDEVPAVANASVRPMSISPFVYGVTSPVALAIGPEVAEAFWFPLDRAASGELDSRLPYPILGIEWTFACWRFEEHVVWGLTHGILRRVLALGAPESVRV
jgi:8-oxo-dGTP pyrophosphatase MutT (NUDIX family)